MHNSACVQAGSFTMAVLAEQAPSLPAYHPLRSDCGGPGPRAEKCRAPVGYHPSHDRTPQDWQDTIRVQQSHGRHPSHALAERPALSSSCPFRIRDMQTVLCFACRGRAECPLFLAFPHSHARRAGCPALGSPTLSRAARVLPVVGLQESIASVNSNQSCPPSESWAHVW
jgi:hypothetical protein